MTNASVELFDFVRTVTKPRISYVNIKFPLGMIPPPAHWSEADHCSVGSLILSPVQARCEISSHVQARCETLSPVQARCEILSLCKRGVRHCLCVGEVCDIVSVVSWMVSWIPCGYEYYLYHYITRNKYSQHMHDYDKQIVFIISTRQKLLY